MPYWILTASSGEPGGSFRRSHWFYFSFWHSTDNWQILVEIWILLMPEVNFEGLWHKKCSFLGKMIKLWGVFLYDLLRIWKSVKWNGAPRRKDLFNECLIIKIGPSVQEELRWQKLRSRNLTFGIPSCCWQGMKQEGDLRKTMLYKE